MGIVAYLDHPLGERDAGGGVSRPDNISNAGEWIRFLIDVTRWTIVAPWHTWAITVGEGQYDQRRFMDSLNALERSDLLIHAGGFIAPHMKYTGGYAKRYGIPLLDLTSVGVGPPDPHDDDAVQVILARARRVILARPRRVWMPLLTQENIDSLIKLRHAVDVHMHDEQLDGLVIVDRIIEKAIDIGNE